MSGPKQHVFRSVEEERLVRAGVDHQENRPHSAGKLYGNEQQTGWRAGLFCLRPYPPGGYAALSPPPASQPSVKTKQAMCIVDQQVELLDEILPQNAPHPGHLRTWRFWKVITPGPFA